MANIHVTTKPLITKTTPYPASVSSGPNALRSAKRAVSPQVASAFEATAADLDNVKSSLNSLHSALRQNSPQVEQVYVTDKAGRVIAALGDFSYQGVITPNYFSEIHVGDPLNTGNPAQALFNAANGRVTVGQNGIVEVLDPFGKDAAWLGTQADTLAVTGAVDNGSGLIRLTVVGHTLATGDTPTVMNVGGVPNATGIFTVTKIDADHIDLQNSVFVGAFTSGGTVNRILHIAGAANNGAGLIRVQTAVAHGYTTGDTANVVAVGGVPNATGQWIVTVFDTTHFDLQGSTFAGAYTSGGTCLRYFAGMLAQTIAIGPSFPNYKLRAFADGSLHIQDALITLVGSASTITLDPSGVGVIEITVNGAGPQLQTILQPANITFGLSDGSGPQSEVGIGGALFSIDSVNGYEVVIALAVAGMQVAGSSATGVIDTSYFIDMTAYTGATVYGPLVALRQARGTGAAPAASQSGDTLGGLVAMGYPDTNYSAGIRAVSTELHSSGVQGTKLVLEVTPNGTFAVVNAATFDQNGRTGLGGNVAPGYPLDVTGDTNTSGVFRKGGAAGLGVTRSFGTSLGLVADTTAVKGTPGVGQSNFSAITAVSLNVTANTFSGGILTA